MPENPTEAIAEKYFESEKVVSHYFTQSHRVGLWKSEKMLFQDLFCQTDHLLDLGCGTGRIAFGLESLGYSRVEGADYSKGMVEGACQIADSIKSRVQFRQADARELPWKDASMDGIIFGFNGFFMIPGADQRYKVLNEIYRVLKPGGRFVFTGHDRSQVNQESYWSYEDDHQLELEQDTLKIDFGDVLETTQLGLMYIHSTSQNEILTQLESAGFSGVKSWLRQELANENSLVREFSDECRFWAAIKR